MRPFLRALFILLLVINVTPVAGQYLLNKNISVDANRKPLKDVLKTISSNGGFYFSYKSDIIKEDSLVSISAKNKSVKQVLDILLGGKIVYKEKDKYIILQPAEQYWLVSGYVFDELSGEGVSYASVYEKQQLVASMTNEKGFFQLKIKDRNQPITISVSKAWYMDTSIAIKPGANQQINFKIKPKDFQLDSVVITPSVEKNWLSQFFLSSKQRMQGLNIDQFFVDKPYQASVVPGLSTHGKMSGQIVNKFSFNVFGGYTAGVNGFEIGGLFNIAKHDMHYAQIGGLFNIVGGDVNGVQIAGLYNQVLDSVTGVQVGGITSIVKESVSGVQVNGIYSHTSASLDGVQVGGVGSFIGDSLDGVQVSGVISITDEKVNGTQVAGVANIAGREVNGAQIAGVVNYAKKLDGVQVGFINIADTSSGVSIGFLNLVWKGYHRLSLGSSEALQATAAFRTGNQRLYSMILGGMNFDRNNKAYAFGYGIGTAMPMGKRFTLNPEFSTQYVYLGDWEHLNLLNRVNLNLNFRINKYLNIHTGPSFNVYHSNTTVANDGYTGALPLSGYHTFEIWSEITGWFGWNAAIDLF